MFLFVMSGLEILICEVRREGKYTQDDSSIAFYLPR